MPLDSNLPEIKIISNTYLLGIHKTMSIAEDQTKALWQEFAPKIKEIQNRSNSNLYSASEYPESHFHSFQPHSRFKKWATVAIKDSRIVSEEFEFLNIKASKYAVFNYTGKPSLAADSFMYIYSQWLPKSGFQLDNRPHLAIMGDEYKGEFDDSKESFWIPIK